MLEAPTIPTEDLDALVKQLGLLDPTDQATRQSRRAPRLATLAGKRIGLLDNRKPNAALLLQELGALLVEQYGLAGTAPVSKFIYSRPAASNLIDELAQCDALITAIGD